MKPKFYSIPEPCSEDWNQMDATAQGAFCAKCTKEVLDCSTLESAEIKLAIDRKPNQCIRVLGSQLDEINFIEWFDNLTLRKQLKYIFLFTFILVFKFNGRSQTPDTSLIQPQYITIDPKDEPNLDEFNRPLELQEENLLSLELSTSKYEWEAETYQIEQCTPTMGFTFLYGDIMRVDYPPATRELIDSHFSLEATEDKLPENIISSNLILINDLKLTFFIEDDTLLFHSNQLDASSIKLKIKQKGSQDWLYKDVVHLKKGQREVHLPLAEFENGIYIIVVEQNGISKAIEIVYW